MTVWSLDPRISAQEKGPERRGQVGRKPLHEPEKCNRFDHHIGLQMCHILHKSVENSCDAKTIHFPLKIGTFLAILSV